ncbi:MAG: hypothetical protein ABFD92_02160 [Planctomycetaceae bacterium]|nr:hypothetical protein [Planctomycetaceae bacterium]
MNYWIWLCRRDGSRRVHRDSFLAGLIPQRVIDMLTIAFADGLGLCHGCTMASRCHVIGPDGTKYCTVLFHDAVRPAWRIEAVL